MSKLRLLVTTASNKKLYTFRKIMYTSTGTVKEDHDTNLLTGDEVVITGISGIFPNSENVSDFMANLYNKVDMITLNNNSNYDPDVPKHVGNIEGINKFDAQFFGVTYYLGCALEPMAKKIMENTYGALFDSGTNPFSLKGKKVGVFIGSAYFDNSSLQLFNVDKLNKHIINGGSKAMLANRISYWLDIKGPSFCLDYSDTSSTQCLELAYKSIVSGDCEAAIVAGCNYVNHPGLTMNMRRAGMLCLDGKTKCFDKNADGYVRASAVNVIFLQRANVARRIYAQVYHAKGTYKMRPDAQFLPLREPEDIEEFLRDVYLETDVDPSTIEYIDAHGAGILEADENELKAINNIFACERSIKIGSVKSNMGHAEAASGLCSLTKLCLAYHQGKLPANLHYNEPQNHISGVCDGRIQVLSESEKFNRGFTAFNNFSFTGANFHVILKGHFKERKLDQYRSNIPRLVLISGRKESSVQKVIDILKGSPLDPEQIVLLNKTYEYNIAGHLGKGYVLLESNEKNETISISESVQYYSGEKRQLWFVYSGMGSQWAAMGADFMRIPIFAAAIHRCHEAMKPYGINLFKIVTEPDNSIFDRTVNAFVGIAAVQIGLTDIIKEMGIVPDSIIGHSLGEMACAYHDNTLTAEEMIKCSYIRGKVVSTNSRVDGAMAAVGLGYEELVNECPPEIDIACHNSSESSTISGPADKIKEFLSKLTKRGVFAREVSCGGVAYHSRYIEHCRSELLKCMSEVIENPKKRSKTWISTSVPQDKWNGPEAVYSSPEYHVNNQLNTVLFEESSQLIPENAIVVEIAPHGLLQAILKRSHKNCTHIPLTKRGTTNAVQFLLEAVGKIYEAGISIKVDVLYPKVEFPVSTETPLLSHFVDWEHSEDWPVLSIVNRSQIKTTASRSCVISVQDDDFKFLDGHVRDGANVLPESAILVLIWETACMNIGVNYKHQSVIFQNIEFQSEVIIKPNEIFRLHIFINKGSDKFEVSHDDVVVASGIISIVNNLSPYHNRSENKNYDDFVEEIVLNLEDVYNIFKSRGYNYGGEFRHIQKTSLDHSEGFVKVNDNWVTFLDSLIQINIIANKYDGISIPKSIRRLQIDIQNHDIANIVLVNGVECYNVQYNEITGALRCAGIALEDIVFLNKPMEHKMRSEYLLSKSFYTHYSMDKIDIKTILQINLQVVAENSVKKQIKITELFTSKFNINHVIEELTPCIPNIEINFSSILDDKIDYEILLKVNSDAGKVNLFIVENVIENEKKLKSLRSITKESFVLAIETKIPKIQDLVKKYFTVVSAMSDGKHVIMLLKRNIIKDITFIHVNYDDKLEWVSRVNEELKKTKRVLLVSDRQAYCGALGFVQNLTKNSEDNIGLMVIEDFRAPRFDPEHVIYKNQIKKNLTINILKKGEWGGFYYQPTKSLKMSRNVTLSSTAIGDVDSLIWKEIPAVPANKQLVQVSYSGISSKDLERAVHNHQASEDVVFGMDYSGIDKHGERVMGLLASGGLSTTLEADVTLMWPVPEHWSLQDAATVPLAYVTAYYCVFLKSQILKGHTVLITDGADEIGQAFIALCLSSECIVFTTVDSEYKKKMLIRLFPQLDENRIGYSRNDSFLITIKTQTNGNGCDLVINRTCGPLREIAMKCVGSFGCFLDLSSGVTNNYHKIGMFYLNGDTTYNGVNISSIFKQENINERIAIQNYICEGIQKGIVRPITRVEYLPNTISRAFRFLSLDNHVGKILIKMRTPEILKDGFNVPPKMNYCSNGVYVVVCDKGDIGIDLADRLIKYGARKLVLHMSTKVSGYFQAKYLSWKKRDVIIKISSEKLHSQMECENFFKEATKIGAVKGIFVIQVSEKEEKSQILFQKLKKVTAFANLDIASRNCCNELSYFVLLSSSDNAFDEYVKSILEKICRARNEIGLPALVVCSSSNMRVFNRDLSSTQILSELFTAMETGLLLKYNNIMAYNMEEKNKTNLNRLEKISNIIGVKNLENVSDETKISDLNLNEITMTELQIFLRNVSQIDCPIEKIQRMTIEKIKALCISNGEIVKAAEGLGVFYTCVDDESDYIMMISHPINPMITLVDDRIQKTLDPTGTYVTMIPGFDGRHQIFSLAAERLKVQAVAVELTSDIEGRTIAEIAANVLKFMRTKFETNSKFYLLGYSFGVNIALELAVLLEKEGHVGVVYCLDSSPDALKIQLKSCIGHLSRSELQNAIIEHFYRLLTDHDPKELQQDLSNTEIWSEKVNVCLRRMKGLTNYSHEYKSELIESAYNRIILAQEYKPEYILESELVLMKSISHYEEDNMTDDYNLSKYTKKPVKVFQLESDHASAPYDCRVSNVVNRLLDNHLLEDYNKKNLCNSYVAYI